MTIYIEVSVGSAGRRLTGEADACDNSRLYRRALYVSASLSRKVNSFSFMAV